MVHNEKFIALVEDAKKRIQEIDVSTLKGQLTSQPHCVLIDVREESEWAKDHLPGAVHLSRGVIELNIERAIPDPKTPIVLYCGGGYRSALVADNLQKMGYSQVYSLAGGYRGWQTAGYPLVND